MRKRTKRICPLGAHLELLEERWVPALTGSIGEGLPIDNLQPYNTLTYCIALEGIFPSQDVSAAPLIGAVELFAGSYAPVGWAECAGQLLQISENEALFSVIGTTYGGDGIDSFALPDLRGRVPIGASAAHPLGSTAGSPAVTLNVDNLAAHAHSLPDISIVGTDSTGGSQPFENMQPSLALTPLVTTVGVYPATDLSANDLLGSVSWFAGNFAPRGYQLAHGQLNMISENGALFSILGTTYGGDGETTFALPDLQGRTALGAGEDYQLGETGGTETNSLDAENLPAHSHSVPGSPPASTGTTGFGESVSNLQPFLALNFDVSQFGLYPTQNLNSGDASPPVDDSVGIGFVSGSEVLDEMVARPLIEQVMRRGIELWQAAGINADQVAALESAQLEIADLEPGRLAFVGEGHVITLDRDAAHRGWFIDATPSDNLEFGSTDPRTGELLATEISSYGHFDLLTAILHEQGHLLGLDHTFLPGAIMYGGLNAGSRILPSGSDLLLTEQAHSTPQFLDATEPFVGSVGMFAGHITPSGWLNADGRVLTYSLSNDLLFSVLGAIHGGNGIDTFALPNLTGRAVVGTGSGYSLGQQGGSATIDLTQSQLPLHAHTFTISTAPTATNLNAAETYTEDTPLNLTDIVVSDVDSSTVTVTITLSNPVAGILSTATSGAVTSTFVPGVGVWTASGAIADVNTLLQGITFTPATDFNSGFNILTSVTDGYAIPITGSKTMTGTAVNDNPVANDDIRPALLLGGPSGKANVLANDTDGDGAPTAPINGTGQFVIDLNPGTAGIQTTFTDSHGTWSLDTATGIVTFAPATGFIGTASIPYTLTDPTGLSDSANITFAVLVKNTDLVPASVVSGSDSTGNAISGNASISADGRYTVFTSNATNLVLGQSDAPDTLDVFLFDNQTKSVTLVSRAAGSPTVAANGESGFAVISADGRFVVYTSSATNLLSGQADNNSGDDIFLYDRESGTTQLVSRVDGTTNTTANQISGHTTLLPGPAAISANGRFVAFVSFANDLVSGQTASSIANVYLFDAQLNTMQIVSRSADSATTSGTGYSLNPVISADGRYVAYTSEARNLVAGQNDHSNWDVFLFDKNLASNPTILVSGAGGSATETGNGESFSDLELAISEDGRYVAFKSFADNLVSGVTDDNHNSDIFLFDRDAVGPRTSLVTHAADSLTTAATGGSASSEKPVMSSDGRFVAYQSTATNIAGNDNNNAYDVFLYDRVNLNNVLVSHGNGSTFSANGASTNPLISSDSTSDNFVIFNSTATNLVPGQADLNGLDDVFIYSRIGFTNSLVSGQAGSAATTTSGASSAAAINPDGTAVVLTSLADNLGGTDLNGVQDVFVRATIVPVTPKFSFRAQSFTAQENGGIARIRVDRTGDTAVTAGVDYRVFTGSGINLATEGLDFVADEGTLIFAPGETTQTFEVTILDDMLAEATERVFLELLDPSPGAELGEIPTSQLNIQDNDGVGLISVNSEGTATGNHLSLGTSYDGPLSSFDGRFVAFESAATDLVAGIVSFSHSFDVYVRDQLKGETILVSRNVQGTGTGNSQSNLLDISSNGVFILFSSMANDLVANVVDTEFTTDLFVFNVLTRTTTLVSCLDTNSLATGNASSYIGQISDDGRYVVFGSEATNLVAGVTDNNLSSTPGHSGLDIFLRDLSTETTTLLSQSVNGNSTGNGESGSPAISSDGRYVAFTNSSSDLDASVSDTNDDFDLFVWDRLDLTGSALSLVSTSVTGGAANGRVGAFDFSQDGRSIVLQSDATDLISGIVDTPNNDIASSNDYDIFVLNLATGARALVSHTAASPTTAGNHLSYQPRISGDGRYVIFKSFASDIAGTVPDQGALYATELLYRYSVETGQIQLVSISDNQDTLLYVLLALGRANQISFDGRYSVFETFTDVSDAVPGITDLNGIRTDVFLADMNQGTVSLISRTSSTTGNGASGSPAISGNGQFVYFRSVSSNLIDLIDVNNDQSHEQGDREDIFVSPGQFNPGTFQFSDADVDVSEDGTEAIVTINRSGGTNGSFVFTVATRASNANNGVDKVATPNVDFLSQNKTVTFEDGQTSATIRIPIVDDGDDEQNETFEVRLTDSSGFQLLGTTTTAIVTIIDDDTTIVGNKITEEDGDVVSITLKGAGTLKLSLVDPDGNGKGPIQVELAGTSVSSSILTIKVTKGANGDGFANVAQITGNGGLKSLAGKQVNLSDQGLDLDGTVLSLALHDLLNGADIVLGGQTSDFIKMALHNTSAGTKIDVSSGIKTLTANRIASTEISAVSGIGTITAGRVVGSSIYASFTPTARQTPLGGGTFAAVVTIKKVTVKGISGEGAAFADSVLAAAKIGAVSLASYDLTVFPGTFEEYGIVAKLSIDKVTSKAPKLTYNPSGPADQSSGRFHIKRV